MTVDLSRKGIWALGTEVTLDMNIITALEEESKDSKVKSDITIIEEDKIINNMDRGNEKDENAVIIRHDNHDINGVASNDERASNI